MHRDRLDYDLWHAHRPLGDSWPAVGPRRMDLWLSRCVDLMFCLSEEREIVPGVATGRLHGVLAAELFGHSVLDLQPGDKPVQVWVVSGRVWE